ncbi:hypothetical protein [Mesorhizobium intechi]|nr:hypothetical protein [Mesorhizobium intechi]
MAETPELAEENGLIAPRGALTPYVEKFNDIETPLFTLILGH